MNKRILVSIILAAFLIFFIEPLPFLAQAPENIKISAKSAILIDAKTGKVLYEKNSNQVMQMASTTKIMTTLLCIESGNLDEYFEVDANAIKVEGSSMGIVAGDKVTKRVLCYGMMLPSGNDAANATAVKIAGSIEKFVAMMNERAKKIGMKNTNFVTPSGLDDYTNYHYSTAYDMALLTQEALKNTTFKEICSTKNARVEFGNPPYARWLHNSNKLLSSYQGIIGVKTGFTDKAKRCLVSACELNGATLICVTLNAPSDWNDHVNLYNYGFSLVKKVEVPIDNMYMSMNVVGGKKNIAYVKQKEAVNITSVGLETLDVEKQIILPHFAYAPIKKGDVVGRADYLVSGKVVQSVPILADEDIDELYIKPKTSLKDLLSNFINKFK